ncbi:hypothetical protein FOG24_04680 [Klebsiella grimontii]|uniref:Uncharacterized protein n=1 Tax=Klebsiella grimontii TaxID=2058152 RepID=A0A285B4Q2_9ENTR|nr:hypothetical protein [Klebsiella grimontii]SNU35875.1 hypothetical protein KOSB73_260599 [Klebsiella grimontii]
MHITTFVGKNPHSNAGKSLTQVICGVGCLPLNSPPVEGSKIALPPRLRVNTKINIATPLHN